MNIKEMSLYTEAVERVLRKETLKSIGELPKSSKALKELEHDYKAKIKETSNRILNGELDEEIKKEIELIKIEQKKKEEEQER